MMGERGSEAYEYGYRFGVVQGLRQCLESSKNEKSVNAITV